MSWHQDNVPKRKNNKFKYLSKETNKKPILELKQQCNKSFYREGVIYMVVDGMPQF